MPKQRAFTLADQVNQLVSASEADPDMGFMARTMALCSLPRSNPGNRHQYKRVNGPFTLYMNATADHKLPYGNLPRLILAWVCTETVRTSSKSDDSVNKSILGKTQSQNPGDSLRSGTGANNGAVLPAPKQPFLLGKNWRGGSRGTGCA